MEKITPESHLSKSADIIQENIEQLIQLFPEVFSEGKIDFEMLQKTLGDYTDKETERFTFSWNGKEKARREAQKTSTGTLRPMSKESVDWEQTKNLFFEGDNLEVLKLLQKSYLGRIKMIYIDPPYNTGNDFIYPDDYSESLQTYLKYTGQLDNEGRKFSTNSETDGRFHSKWLNMMYPRLKLARNLLRSDGVIFVSIEDTEASNLQGLLNSIFGEENFVGRFVWQSKKGGGSDSSTVVQDHEYVTCFAKNINQVELGSVEIEAEPLDKEDDQGRYRRGRELNKWGSNSRRIDRPTMWFPIPGPNGEEVFPIKNDGTEGCWRFGRKSMMEFVEKKNIEFVLRENGTFIAYEKIRTEENRSKPYRTWLSDVNATSEGSIIVRELFDGQKVFSFPKPLSLLTRTLEIGTTSDRDIVLDFFAGSASMAQSVLEFNIEEPNANLNFIMVQLPEPTEEKSDAFQAGFKNIAEIGKERIRRVIKKIQKEHPEKAKNMDLGFKVFKLDSSNIKAWDPDCDNLEDTLFESVDNIKPDRSEADLLYEILLKFGLDLAVPIEEFKVGENTVYNVGMGALWVCLSKDISQETVEAIGKQKEKLEPETCRVVFRDNGFQNDAAKTNAMQILKRYGITEVRSI